MSVPALIVRFLPASERGGGRGAAWAVACVVAVFLIRATLALTVIPPWQQPDEPQHVLAVWYAGTDDRSEQAVARMEGRILESMALHRWWALVGLEAPTPMPARFADSPELFARHIVLITDGGTYYRLASGLAHSADPERILRVARVLSSVLAACTLVFAYAMSRRLLGAWSGVGVAALLGAHPQFALIGTTAGADAFVGCLAAAALWAVVRSMDARRALPWLVTAVGLSVIAGLSRRLGLTVGLVTCWALFVGLYWRGRREAWRLGAALLAILVALAALLTLTFGEAVRTGAASLLRMVEASRGTFATMGDVTSLHQSTWLTAGWLRFTPAPSWQAMLALLSTVAAVGFVVAATARQGRLRRAVVLAGGAVALQLAALCLRQWVVGEGGQGRYLTPVAVPLAVLLWIGVVGWVPARWQGLVGATVLALVLAFDAAGWAQVIAPAFL